MDEFRSLGISSSEQFQGD